MGRQFIEMCHAFPQVKGCFIRATTISPPSLLCFQVETAFLFRLEMKTLFIDEI